ncbi:alpha-N-arabinofuranosidase [Anaerobium acetethylicum]|uniref:Alpha-N-arabinofuranosidase n=2 Tax=Anaerobium acetethylicum TaxID=1619234 RepID=A0A1D3TTU7_9FIRM|nr:alpha-N-arabinofuranosidase [Anaerobium acetethylicum]
MKMNKIKNPILPGFYPDPSICRVGEDYYMVCSSFELYPGIPVFHSKDLANWEQISYAMNKENGFHVNANVISGGVMAPTIRYHEGLFYIINANFGDKGNFIVTAEDPAGKWSDPCWIPEITDLDASLFFDDDGKVYIVSPGKANEDNGRGIFITGFDIRTMKPVGEKTHIWNSAMRNAASPESPHIYHIGEYYYLMIAEGGTEHYHAVTVARSRRLTDWYEGNPANPVLTHRHLGFSYPVDNIGHADFVDTPDGEWYAVMLGSRIIEGQHKNLGRETYICPVIWERDWPVFCPGTGKVEMEYPAVPGLQWTEFPKQPEKDDFEKAELGLCWSFWGTPYQEFWNIQDSKLRLKCLSRPITRQLDPIIVGKPDMKKDDCVSFIGRRQTAIDFEASCKMKFAPQEKETAGFVIMQASNHQYRLERKQEDGQQILQLVLVTTEMSSAPHIPGFKSMTRETVLASIQHEGEEIILGVKVKGQDYSFFYGSDEGELSSIFDHADGKLINPEIVGGMVGTMIGMFASGNGKESDNRAEFEWFRYVTEAL